MRRLSSASIFAWLLIVGFASDGTESGAFGYRDTGFDADHAKDAVDIRSTTRKIWQDKKGHRWLSITVRACERLGTDWDMLASIDGRGDPFESPVTRSSTWRGLCTADGRTRTEAGRIR
jgi:hypothetical protein